LNETIALLYFASTRLLLGVPVEVTTPIAVSSTVSAWAAQDTNPELDANSL
jgi:hypothetical protein